MKKRVVLWCLAAAAVLILGVVLFFSFFVVAGGVYPRSAEQLDLREKNLSPESYDRLQRQLPRCEILWSVPFQGGRIDSDTRELTVTSLSETDVLTLDYLTELTRVDGQSCQDYSALAALARRRPGCAVEYTVPIGQKSYPQDARKVTVPSLTAAEAEKLDCLPWLEEVDADGCRDYALLESIRQAHPQWKVTYRVHLGDQALPLDAEAAAVTGAEYEELADGLPFLPELKALTLTDPAMEMEKITRLQADHPAVTIHWELTFGENTYPDDTTEADISDLPLESVEQAERFASYFPKLQKLIVDSGEIDNDTMADFRERMRENYKVVWTVICGTGKYGSFAVRTDETSFMPLKHNIYFFFDEDVYNVRYCEDMIAIDVGHMAITDVSFVENMPHLKYLILALTQVRDITPLSTCKELVFLEVDHTAVTDYSPLLGCTALEDLNLGRTWGDPEPITKMTWLKNLWWVGRSYSVRNTLAETLTETNMLFKPGKKNTTSYGWRKLPNYYAMRDALGMYYME